MPGMLNPGFVTVAAHTLAQNAALTSAIDRY